MSVQKEKYTMKRYLTIILLCILAACALTSCEKDKSNEIVNTYADFVKSNYIGETTYAAFVANLVTGSNNITLNSSSHIKAGLIGNLLHAVGGYTWFENVDVTIESGQIQGTSTGGNVDITIKDAKFKATFDVIGSDGNKKSETMEFLINLHYVKNEEGVYNSQSFTYNINGTSASISYKVDLSIPRFITATVNGKAVDFRLLDLAPYVNL